MELIVLKMPPERVAMLADALQRDIANGAPEGQVKELTQILVWLRYRHGKYLAAKSVAGVRNRKPPRTPRR